MVCRPSDFITQLDKAADEKWLTYDADNIHVNLPAKHEYLFLRGNTNISEHLRDGILEVAFHAPCSEIISAIVSVFDQDKKRLFNKLIPPGGEERIPICDHPQAATFRVGLRLKGVGVCSFEKITIGSAVSSNVLILSNQYPSYDDLYKYMFVHTRVKAYQKLGYNHTVMRHHLHCANNIREFEAVQVLEGDSEVLASVLASGKINTVCAHFFDENKFEVVQPYLENIRLIIWLHGNEIQPYWRREWNHNSEDELARARRGTVRKIVFWSKLFELAKTNKIHFVFVSEYFKNEVFCDYNVNLPPHMYSIIHNPINTDLFCYNTKPAELRKNIISIRSFTSYKYANDLTVKTILELSQYDEFRDMSFHIGGVGPMFDEIVEPLRNFPNVTLANRFYNQTEMSELYKTSGICLIPTRMDSQGVTRDEAMASGLVPVTNSVAAVPEFVDSTCGILAPAEDHIEMAAGILEMYRNPKKFQELSKNAAARVRKQSAADVVSVKEIAVIQN